MREIKCRAWDDEAEIMFYSDNPPDNYFFAFKDGILRGFAIRSPQPSSDPMEPPEPYTDDFPVMLYTGLKDKNGTEIYEEDILPGQWVVMWWAEQAQFVLGNGSLDVNEAAKEEFVIGLLNRDEIIGNIHQNSDLLEQDNG